MLSVHFQHLNPEGTFSLCILSIMGTVGLSALMLLPLLVGTYVDHLGFSEDIAGWVSTINLAGITFMTLIMSLKAKHWSLPRVAVFALLGMIIFDLLSCVTSSLYTIAIFRFLSGLAGGAIGSVVAAAIARLEHSDKGYGIYIGFQFMLPSLAFYFLPDLLPEIGFAGLMQTLIVLEALLLLLTPILANYPIPDFRDGKNPAQQLEWQSIMQPVALLSLAGLCLYGTANAAFYAYAERIGLHTGLSGRETGTALAWANMLAILGALLVVWLQDRFGHLKPLATGIALQILAMLILLNYPTTTGYWLGLIVWSVAWAFSWPYFLSMQANIDSSGTVVVAGQFTNLLGNSIGPAMAGYLLIGGTYNHIIWLTSILFLLSLIPMYFVSRQLSRPVKSSPLEARS